MKLSADATAAASSALRVCAGVVRQPAVRHAREAAVAMRFMFRLTVKLRGRAEAPDKRRGRTLSPGARGAKQTTPHGPLQRLLGVARGIIAWGHGAPAQTTQRVAIPLSYVACSKLAAAVGCQGCRMSCEGPQSKLG